MPKQGREKTRFHDDLALRDLNAALLAGLTRRAGRALDSTISSDRLLDDDRSQKQSVHIRRLSNGKPLFHPAFSRSDERCAAGQRMSDSPFWQVSAPRHVPDSAARS